MAVNPECCPHTNAHETGRTTKNGMTVIFMHCDTCGKNFKEQE